MKFKIFKFANVTSTNDVAINLIKEKKIDFGCVYADIQTKGRGTQGKKWISNKGNLFMTLFFPLKGNFPPFNEFSIINSIIVSDVIKHYSEKGNMNLKLDKDYILKNAKIFNGISINDKQRLQRALSVYNHTGKPLWLWQKKYRFFQTLT